MERNQEFINNAKMEQLAEEDLNNVAGGVVSVQISGVKKEGAGGYHYSVDTFMLDQMKKELDDKYTKKVENLLRSGEW